MCARCGEERGNKQTIETVKIYGKTKVKEKRHSGEREGLERQRDGGERGKRGETGKGFDTVC